jgi:hypothetical protein
MAFLASLELISGLVVAALRAYPIFQRRGEVSLALRGLVVL